MATFRHALNRLERDINKCKEWLAAIKAFFIREEKLFMRYRNELMKLGRAIKNSKALRSKRDAEKAEAACMRIGFLLDGMKDLSRKIIRATKVETKVTVANEKDFDKVSHGIDEEYYKAIVFSIHSDLRAAFVELRKLIVLANNINYLLNEEARRIGPIKRLAERAGKGYSEELVIQARLHVDEKVSEDGEEIKKKISDSLNSAVRYFRLVMEVGEELAEKEKAEFEEIKKISVIETKLQSAEMELRNVG